MLPSLFPLFFLWMMLSLHHLDLFTALPFTQPNKQSSQKRLYKNICTIMGNQVLTNGLVSPNNTMKIHIMGLQPSAGRARWVSQSDPWLERALSQPFPSPFLALSQPFPSPFLALSQPFPSPQALHTLIRVKILVHSLGVSKENSVSNNIYIHKIHTHIH